MRAPSIPVDAIGFGAQASSSSGSLSTLAGATGGRFTIVDTQDELRATLGRLVQHAVSAPRFEISFDYPSVPDRLVSSPASLLYAPVGGTPTEWALDLRLSAMAPQPAAAPAPPPSGRWLWLPVPPSPSFAWLGASLLMATLVGIVALHRRRRPEAARRGRPDVVPSPSAQVAAPSAQVSTPSPPPPAPARRMTMIAHRWPAPDGEQPVAMLFVTSGAGAGRCFEIRRSQTGIGSADDNEVVLADDFASGHHAMLRADSNALYLADLGSSNGSLLRGERFKNGVRALTPGDRSRWDAPSSRWQALKRRRGRGGRLRCESTEFCVRASRSHGCLAHARRPAMCAPPTKTAWVGANRLRRLVRRLGRNGRLPRRRIGGRDHRAGPSGEDRCDPGGLRALLGPDPPSLPGRQSRSLRSARGW